MLLVYSNFREDFVVIYLLLIDGKNYTTASLGAI
jgi:hypothetical protein